MTNTAGTGDLEQRALELLPWYANGTLEGEERELVARQVLASLTCRKELERLRRLHQLMQRDDAEAAATDREFERLMARIHASDTPKRSGARRPRRRARMVAVRPRRHRGRDRGHVAVVGNSHILHLLRTPMKR